MNENLIFVLFACAVTVAWTFSTYNSLIKKRNLLREAWSGIDVALKQRTNLIPNLLRTVKGYGKYETTVLDKTTQQRTNSDTVTGRGEEESEISQSLSSLLAVAESYPDLKANHSFLDLQKNLSDIELQINNARTRYNQSVTRYNTQVESVPSNVIAGIFKFRSADYFQIDLATQRILPEVDL